MGTTKAQQQQQQQPPFHYCSIPPDPNTNPHQEEPYYILLPYYRHPTRRHLKGLLLCFATLTVIILAIFFLYPSDPKLSIVRLQLNNVEPHLSPPVSLDISMALTVRVRNRDFFSFKYDSLHVSIGYRGRELGVVNSELGVLKPRASSYVNATLVLDGVKVIHDVLYLIQDLAKGCIPFDTVTQVSGSLGLLFFQVPIKAKVSCEVSVDTANQTIVRQDCYPE